MFTISIYHPSWYSINIETKTHFGICQWTWFKWQFFLLCQFRMTTCIWGECVTYTIKYIQPISKAQSSTSTQLNWKKCHSAFRMHKYWTTPYTLLSQNSVINSSTIQHSINFIELSVLTNQPLDYIIYLL